jgi:hypothetical protein
MISSARVSRHITLSAEKHHKLKTSPLMATTGNLSRALEALVTRYLQRPGDFLVEAVKLPCVFPTSAGELSPELRWTGEGPAPAYWYVNGVKVYRSYEDYVDG